MSQALVDAHIAHETWIQRCIELAVRGAGHVSPNPLVGSVLVDREGMVLGEGWHRVYGEAHAERHAIADAIERYGSDRLKEATLYVNLEPCSHFGKTPPCSDLIIEHAIPRVVIGMVDPNPSVRGAGIAQLRAHGIEVIEGVCEAQCQRTNEAFSHLIETGRPLLTLKMAQTLDGRIATRTGDSQWISGEASRSLVHTWRATLDAVLIGAGTALADDPSLTVRHVEGRQPWRIVLDREGRLPTSLKLFADDFVDKTIVVVSEEVTPSYAMALENEGGVLMRVPVQYGHLDLCALLDTLGSKSDRLPRFQSILTEAGPNLATALFDQDLVDRLALFIAPKLIGAGLPVLEGMQINEMSAAYTFAESQWEQVGDDMLFWGYRRSFG